MVLNKTTTTKIVGGVLQKICIQLKMYIHVFMIEQKTEVFKYIIV